MTSEIKKLTFLLIFTNVILAGLIFWLYRQISIKPAEIFVQMPYMPANIKIDANNIKGPINPFWLGLAQGGEERGGMIPPTVDKIKQLRPSYIRLDHIFDDDYYGVVSCPAGNLQFDFSRLDREVAAIQATGAKPFLSLSYMPGCLAGSKIEVPKNWGDWQTLVQKTVEHYSGSLGIPGVYYEVWNEPDLEHFGKWGRGGDKNYLTLYSYSARGAQAATGVQPFFIGGPATTDLYQNWVMDLYDFCGANSLRLDFISWHAYTMDVLRYSQYIADIHSWLGDRPVPRLVISEWGPTPDKSNVYSTNFAAAYSFAVVRQLLDLVNLVTVFEIKDGPGQENSGWGLLSHETSGLVPKPRYQAFSWLSQVKGQRLGFWGEGSNVTGWAARLPARQAQDGDNLTIWLVNYGPGAQTEAVPIEIDNLENGSWQVKREVMFESGDTQEVVIENNTLQTNLELAPNQVGRITLNKN